MALHWFHTVWLQVELFLYQAAGLSDGVTGKLNKPNTDIDPMGF